MTSYAKGYPNPRSWYSQRMDTVGDGSGVINAIGDYSAAATYFRVRADQRHLTLTGMSVKVRGAGAMTASNYGTIAQLANGVALHLLDPDDKLLVDWMSGEPVKSNGDWGEFTTNFRITEFGAGDNFIAVGFRVPDPNDPIYLPEGFSLAMLCQDDFTDLNRHIFQAFGRYVKGFG